MVNGLYNVKFAFLQHILYYTKFMDITLCNRTIGKCRTSTYDISPLSLAE